MTQAFLFQVWESFIDFGSAFTDDVVGIVDFLHLNPVAAFQFTLN